MDVPVVRPPDEVARFWAKVTKLPGDGCWPWTAARNDSGHGRFGLTGGRVVYAHVYAYSITVGPVPDGHDLHHTCDNPWCVRVGHLVPRTKADHGRISSLRRRGSQQHRSLGPALAELMTEQLNALQHVQDDVRPTKRNVGMYSLALVDEVMELAKEIGVKDWKPRTPPDRARLADEFADVLCFVGTLTWFTCEHGGLTPDDLAEAFKRKVAVNLDRFNGRVSGYGKNDDGGATPVSVEPTVDPAPVGGPPAKFVTPNNGVRPTAVVTMPVVPHVPIASVEELETGGRYVLQGSWGAIIGRCVHVDHMAKVATMKSEGGTTYTWVQGGSAWQVLKPTREGVAR